MKAGSYIRHRIEAERRAAAELREEADQLEKQAVWRRERAAECDEKAASWAAGTDAQ
jgi:hypothetical protein